MKKRFISDEEFAAHKVRCFPVSKGEAVKYSLAKKDPVYFVVNQLGIRPFTWQAEVLDDLALGRNTLLCTSRQIGKEQPYSAIVQTPTGERTMGSLVVGDEVFGSDGKPTKVLQIYEQGEKDVYRVEFTDGSVTECGLEHLWTYKFGGTKNWKVASLKELLEKKGPNPNSDNGFRIPLCSPVRFQEKEHLISPYVLGVLLGDGGLSSGSLRYSNIDKEIIERVEREVGRNAIFSSDGRCTYSIRFPEETRNPFIKELKRMNLWGTKSDNKFVPQEYLVDSIENRKELLRGLMDTDGSIYGKNVMEFCSKSEDLARDVKWLVQSLGGKVIHKKKYNKQHDTTYQRLFLKFWNLNPFYVSRKAKKYYNIRYEPTRIVRRINKVGVENSRCIVVDNEDHTYLTNEFIVTHNTALFAWFALWACVFNTIPMPTTKKTKIIFVSKTDGQALKVISDVREFMRLGDDRVFELTGGKVVDFFSNKMAKGENTVNTKSVITFDNGSQIISLPPTDAARGFTGSQLFMDEVAFIPDDIITTVLLPMVSATGNRASAASTPNGKQGWFYKQFDPDDQMPEHSFKRFWCPYDVIRHEDPDRVELKDKDKQLALRLGEEREFLQEYEADFTASASGFFGNEEIERCTDHDLDTVMEFSGECDMGIDFGKKVSRTVITITTLENRKDLDPRIRVLYQYEYGEEKGIGQDLVDDVAQLLKQFNVRHVIVEDCPQSAFFQQACQVRGWPMVIFQPSVDKDKQYWRLRAWMKQDKVVFPNIPELIKQMYGLVVIKLPTKERIEHGAGLRDDCIDSLVIATFRQTEDRGKLRVLM